MLTNPFLHRSKLGILHGLGLKFSLVLVVDIVFPFGGSSPCSVSFWYIL